MALLNYIFGAKSAAAQVVADAGLTGLAEDFAEVISVNIMQVITTNLPTIAIIGLAIVAVGMVWYFLKRFVSGS